MEQSRISETYDSTEETKLSGKTSARYSSATENLALMYQELLTIIVRVQAGRQQIPDTEAFRQRMKTLLNDIKRNASKLDYTNEDINDAHFAIVAFLDEAVLTSNDPSRSQWGKRSLQEELFGQANAGEVFFERLDRLRHRHDSPQLADVIEVYALCVLLGFEGRYALGNKGELQMLIDDLERRIGRIRGRSKRLSPEAELPVEAVHAPPASLLTKKLRILALMSVVFAILCFVVLKLNLFWNADELATRIQKNRSFLTSEDR